ncbi:MAG: isoprenyl transferase [Cyanobacteria bacterium P01_H01_bin.15]
MNLTDFIQRPAALNPARLPQHVAVIMDGNGRWANSQGLPRIAGHRRGAQRLKELLRYCKAWGIGTLSAYAFSTENWGRPTPEVNFLMQLFERLLQQELETLHQEKVRICFIGDLSILPKSLQRIIQQAMQKTLQNQGIIFNVALNYGSRQELTYVCRAIAADVLQNRLELDNIREETITQRLYTQHCTEPDLLIRTSGEKRLSNFLLWQLAYSEMYFTQTPWPEFDHHEFHQALLAYQNRDRRFGKLNQLAPLSIATEV